MGSNMFAYCLNNPVIYVDKCGSEPATIAIGSVAISIKIVIPIVAVVVVAAILTDPVVQDTIADVASAITETVGDWIDEQKRGFENQLVTSLTKAPPSQNEKYHVHHIIAQADYRAAPARYILEDCLNISVNNVVNLVMVKASVHRRLHNKWYFNTVNFMVMQAYTSAGMDKAKQYANVTAVLAALRGYIDSLNALSAG